MNYLGYVRTRPGDDTPSQKFKKVIYEAYEKVYRKLGFKLGYIYEDIGISCHIPVSSRPEGYRMCLAAEEGDVIAIPSFCHAWNLTQDYLNDLEVWASQGVRVVLLDLMVDTGTEEGQKFMSYLRYFREIESGAKQRYYQESKGYDKDSGIDIYLCPYGWKRVKATKGRKHVLEPDEEQRELGRLLVGMSDAGMNNEAIAEQCRARKIRNPRTGKVLTKSTIQNFLKLERKLQEREKSK